MYPLNLTGRSNASPFEPRSMLVTKGARPAMYSPTVCVPATWNFDKIKSIFIHKLYSILGNTEFLQKITDDTISMCLL